MKQKELEKLIEAHARAEVMARLGSFPSSKNYSFIMIELMDEIRRKLFGTSDLVELSKKFKLLSFNKHKKKAIKKKRIKKKIKLKFNKERIG